MEFKFAIYFLNSVVKAKLLKVLADWKKISVGKTLKMKRRVRVRVNKTDFNSVCLTEPSPVSSKIMKKNRFALINSSKYNCFQLKPQIGRNRPVPIMPYHHIKASSHLCKIQPFKKENCITRDDVAIVSSISASIY